MKLPRRKFLHFAAGVAVLPFISRLAPAQSYPSRPVRLIVGAVPGSAPDVIAQLMAQWLSESLGQAFVVENRIGASGNLAAEAVVRAKADGYTLLLASASDAINATLYDNLNFSFIRDIAPVAGLGGAVLPGSPAEFGKYIADETEKWAKVIKFADIKPQ